MESRDFALLAAECLAEKKAEDIVILEVTELVGYTDFVVIAAARSGRQMKAIAEHLEHRVREATDQRPFGKEGIEEGNWALVDYGDVIIHVFRGEERLFYDLEGLWSEAPQVPFNAEAVLQTAP